MGTHTRKTKAKRDSAQEMIGKSKKFRDARTKYFIDVKAELEVNNTNGITTSIVLKVR